MVFCKLISSCSNERVIIMIKEISVDIIGFNFLVGAIDDRQAVVYFTEDKTSNHSKVSTVYTILNHKGIPYYPQFDSLDSVHLVDKKDVDVPLIPLSSLKRVSYGIYEAEDILITQSFIDKYGVFELCDEEQEKEK